MTRAFITINCVDRDVSGEFYRSVFDAKYAPDQDFNLGGFVYNIGSLRIVLLHNAGGRAASVFPDHAMVMLTIEVSDVFDTYRKAAASKGTVIEAPVTGDDCMLLTDPDGIVIEVFRSEPI